MARNIWLILVLVSVLAISCGGGDDKAANGSPESSLTTTPRPTPVVSGTHVEYAAKGYAVDFPSGWTFDPDAVTAGPLMVDAFFSPDTGSGVQPSVAIACEVVPKGTTLGQYVVSHMQTLKELDARGLTEEGGSVAGVEARVLRYQQVRDDVAADKVEYVFIGPACAYVLALTTPAGEAGAYATEMNVFLDSFSLLR